MPRRSRRAPAVFREEGEYWTLAYEGTDAERLRKAVGNRIRESLARIRERHDLLGRHLANAIRAGLFCCYDPERRTPWQISTLREERHSGASRARSIATRDVAPLLRTPSVTHEHQQKRPHKHEDRTLPV